MTIDIDAGARFQSMAGVGAALTDSSAQLISSKLDDSARASLIDDLFGSSGARLGYIRVPISSTDFSTEDYTFDDLPWPQTDPDLESFDLGPAERITIPLLHEILDVNPSAKLMASAWSAPGWMKVGGNPLVRKGLIGGTLGPSYAQTYASYLRRVVEEYGLRGLPFDAMTLQNEPAYTPPDYPGMALSIAQEAELAAAVGAQFNEAGLQTSILAHDHNWDLAARAIDLLAHPAASQVDGTAFHCYGGDPSAQSSVRASFPDKDIYFTECSGTFGLGTFSSNLMWNVNNLVIGATRNWAKTVLLWNLALDESGQPHTGGCSQCRGVVTIDSATGNVVRNEEYYALGHLGRAISDGSERIASTSVSGTVRSVAFVNPDSSKSLVLSNDSATASTVRVREAGRSFIYTLPARSVATFSWQ